MAIEKLQKGSDALFNIHLTDAEGKPFRVSDLFAFAIRFYTLDSNNYVEYSYQNGEYDGIVANEDGDTVVINADELEPLEDGVLNYVYYLKAGNTLFSDGFYDECVKGHTNIYLKSNLNCNG